MVPISAERWRQLTPILDEAFELDPNERPAYLDRACAGDSALRADIESLLEASLASGEFLEAPLDAYLAGLGVSASDLVAAERPTPTAAAADQPIGPYRIVGELASGGMGTVYVAERAD